MNQVVRYTEEFKQQVLRDLEEGKYATRAQAAKAYGLSGPGMITYWAGKYGKTHLMANVAHVSTRQEALELRALRERVLELKKELAATRKGRRPHGKPPASMAKQEKTAELAHAS